MAVQDLIEKRNRLWEESKAILKKAEDEKRDTLTSEETEHWDRLDREMDALKATIERQTKSEQIEAELTESRGRRSEPSGPPRRNDPPHRANPFTPMDDENTRLEGLRTWLLAGSMERGRLSNEQVESAKRVGFDPDKKVLDISLSLKPMKRLSEAEDWMYRAQGVATGSVGLFTVPNELMRPLEVALLTFGGMRQVATVIRTDTGANLPIPTVNDTGNVGAIVVENTTVTQQDVAFGQLVLGAYKYSSKMILVSVELMQDSATNLASFLGDALGTRIGRITNTHFTTGSGTGQPFGIVTQATLGKTGASGQAGSVIFDDLVDLEHSVDPAYRQGARFMMHDGTLKAIKKLKDSQGRPLFLPGISSTNPDTILGYPFVINQDVAQMSTTTKSIVFGSLDKYLIRDVRGVTLLRLDERFAEFHQVAFLAFARFDGNLLNAGTNPVKYYQHPGT